MASTPVKKSKAAAKPSHPPFKTLCLQALRAQRDAKVRSSSRIAITKVVIAQNKLNLDAVKVSRFVGNACKKLAEEGKILRVTGVGATGSFRLPPKQTEVKPKKKPAAKKPKKPTTPKKKPAAAKTAGAKKTTPKKKPAAKKAATKKPAAAKKTTPKKKPAAKKPAAKKPAAKKPAAKKTAAKKSK